MTDTPPRPRTIEVDETTWTELERKARAYDVHPDEMVAILLDRERRSIVLEQGEFDWAKAQARETGRALKLFVAQCVRDSRDKNKELWRARLMNTALQLKLSRMTN